MKTFKEFLIERYIKKPELEEVSELEHVMKLLNTHCSDWVKNNKDLKTVLWRGTRKLGNAEVFIVDSTDSKRTSRDMTNHYMSLMTGPAWEGFAYRDKSIICTTLSAAASRYGVDKYAVIPFDGTNLSVAPASDGDLFNLKTRIDIKLHDVSGTPKKSHVYKITNMADATAFLKTVLKIKDSDAATLSSMREAAKTKGIIKYHDLKISVIDTFDALVEVFTPKKLGCYLTNTVDKNFPQSGSCEVWFSGKALFIKEDLFKLISNRTTVTKSTESNTYVNYWLDKLVTDYPKYEGCFSSKKYNLATKKFWDLSYKEQNEILKIGKSEKYGNVLKLLYK